MGQSTLGCSGLLLQRGVERFGSNFVNNANVLKGKKTKQTKSNSGIFILMLENK